MISISYAYDTYGGLNTIMNQLSAHEFGLKIRLREKSNEGEEEQIETDQTKSDLN